MVNSISYGPCWCGGDGTSGGHWHRSADGTDQIIDPQHNDLMGELRAIRSLLEQLVGAGIGDNDARN